MNHDSPAIFSVSEISQSIRRLLETSYGSVQIRGEISAFKEHPSGHAYFDLKDEKTALRCAFFKTMLQAFKNAHSLALEDGLEVIAHGKISAYRSQYQLIVHSLELAGNGALLRKFEALKNKLATEGLFKTEHKKTLPHYPNTIGVITSPTGAVIADIIHRLQERFPVRLVLIPTLVQGEKAAEQIVQAINMASAYSDNPDQAPLDLLIIARGGGSIEDLWAFNEEKVVRAAAQCKIPIISAIGHETDYTLLDFVADYRAPTPTAAAEMAVPLKHHIQDNIEKLGRRLHHHLTSLYAQCESYVELAGQRLQQMLYQQHISHTHLIERLQDRHTYAYQHYMSVLTKRLISAQLRPPADVYPYQHRLDSQDIRLRSAVRYHVHALTKQVETAQRLIEGLSYKNTLKRGYVIVEDPVCKRYIHRGQEVGSTIRLHFWDGQFDFDIQSAQQLLRHL